MTPAERAHVRRLLAASDAALHGPEFRATLDALKARGEAAARRPIPARMSDVQFDSDMDRTEGGPDIIRSSFA